MSEIPDTSLWLIDNIEKAYFDEPSLAELTFSWAEKRPNARPLILPEGIYGVAEIPETPPKAVVAIDLDEIVRSSGLALLQIKGGGLADMVADGQTGYMDYGSSLNGWDDQPSRDAQTMRHVMLKELMQADLVQPVEHHEAIASFMRQWRERGAYVIINTSTLSGCEVSTIEFLTNHFPDCTQGLLLPRNHDGLGKTTKAEALQATLEAMREQTGWRIDETPVVAIDDASHHAISYSRAGIKTFMPAYDWNTGCQGVEDIEIVKPHHTGTVDTFIAADRYLAKHI